MTLRIVFFGTPPFAAKTLAYLVKQGVDVAAVVTKPDKPQGRSSRLIPSAVKAWAQEHLPSVPIHQPKRISKPEEAEQLQQYDADFFVVVAFGEIVKQNLIDMPRLGCVNVHPSLLPLYRGPAPIQRAVMAGDARTGVTIMNMVLKMDAGDILQTLEVKIAPEVTGGELEEVLCNAGAMLLLDTLKKMVDEAITPIPQDDAAATLAPKITPDDGKIDWSANCVAIHNIARALTPRPLAWCHYQHRGVIKRIKLADTTPLIEVSAVSGQPISTSQHSLVIGCGEGALAVGTVQPEGKRAMAASEFLRGIGKEELCFL